MDCHVGLCLKIAIPQNPIVEDIILKLTFPPRTEFFILMNIIFPRNLVVAYIVAMFCGYPGYPHFFGRFSLAERIPPQGLILPGSFVVFMETSIPHCGVRICSGGDVAKEVSHHYPLVICYIAIEKWP